MYNTKNKILGDWSIAKWQGIRFWYGYSKVRILLLQIWMAGITQLVRVPNCGFGSYGFDSRYSPLLYSLDKNKENKKISKEEIKKIPIIIWLKISGGVSKVAKIKKDR